MSQNPAQPTPGTVICALADLPNPGAKGFTYRLTTAIFQGLIVREGDQVRGYVDRCPHAGWPLSVLPDRYLTKDGKFLICSSHGALFMKDTGECISGPCAGDRLSTWPVTVEDGLVKALVDDTPREPFSDDEVERYARHLVLNEIGGTGQQKLRAAKVLIVGAGGLGSPAALYLAAAGVGTLGLVDPDTATLSNLQRQILYTERDLGRPKVERAAARLEALNPHVTVEAFETEVTTENAAKFIRPFDLVLDGTDNFETRLAVSDACAVEGKPLISGALGRWTGQVGVFTGRPCYRCLVPEAPPNAETCAAVGVVGALAGVIGSMMALEAVKLITGAGQPLTGRLLIYDGLAGETRTVKVGADPSCKYCPTHK